MNRLSGIDITIVLCYLAGIMLLGIWLGRRQKTEQDYFLAGRKLRWWMVGPSLVVSDIGALELMGVSGGAYVFGFALANLDWLACIFPMVLAAFLFIPLFWRTRIYTIPEYIGRRYNDAVRTLVALIWGCFMVANLGIFLWVSTQALHHLTGLSVSHAMLITAVVVGVYTFYGGLRAVVVTDTIQYVILVIGSIVILAIAWLKVGGLEGMHAAIDTSTPERAHYFNTILPVDSPSGYAWPAVLFGLMLVLGPAYWGGNQAIVQRCLGTGSERDAKKSVLFGALLKSIIPFVIVLPGMFGLVLYPGLEKGDEIYPTMLGDLLPVGLAGIVFAAFLAALMSSVDSYLNSASTLWTMDIYKRYIRPGASHEDLFRTGKVLTLVFIFIAILLAPLTDKFEGVFNAFVTLLSIFQGPTFAILLLGVIWKRANSVGAVAGLVVGVTVSSTLSYLGDAVFDAAEPGFYVAWWSFASSMIATISFSLVTRPRPYHEIRELMFRKTGE